MGPRVLPLHRPVPLFCGTVSSVVGTVWLSPRRPQEPDRLPDPLSETLSAPPPLLPPLAMLCWDLWVPPFPLSHSLEGPRRSPTEGLVSP